MYLERGKGPLPSQVLNVSKPFSRWTAAWVDVNIILSRLWLMLLNCFSHQSFSFNHFPTYLYYFFRKLLVSHLVRPNWAFSFDLLFGSGLFFKNLKDASSLDMLRSQNWQWRDSAPCESLLSSSFTAFLFGACAKLKILQYGNFRQKGRARV